MLPIWGVSPCLPIAPHGDTHSCLSADKVTSALSQSSLYAPALLQTAWQLCPMLLAPLSPTTAAHLVAIRCALGGPQLVPQDLSTPPPHGLPPILGLLPPSYSYPSSLPSPEPLCKPVMADDCAWIRNEVKLDRMLWPSIRVKSMRELSPRLRTSRGFTNASNIP